MKVAALLILIAASAAPCAAAAPPKRVVTDAATQRRLAILTAPAPAATQAASVTGFGRVLDAGPLAQLDADIVAARSAAAASTAEAERSRALFAADATVSRKVYDAAAMQASADSAKLRLLRRRLGLEWGPAIAAMGDAARARLVDALAGGRTALVRIDSAGGAGLTGARTVLLDLGALGKANAAVLGAARTADPRLQSPGLLARVDGIKAALLASGLSVPATIGAASSASGVIVPPAALLRLDGASWVYVQAGATGFDRRRVDGVIARGDGLFVRSGIRPGERIVVRGASQLYAAEQGGGPAAD